MTAFEIISTLIGVLSLICAYGGLIIMILNYLTNKNRRDSKEE